MGAKADVEQKATDKATDKPTDKSAEKVADKPKKKKQSGRNPVRRIARVCAVILCVLIAAAAVFLIILFVMYQTGKHSLYAKAENSAPMSVNTQQELLDAREQAGLAAVQWQSDWIAMDGRIYEYNEDTINLLFLGIDHAGGLVRDTDYSEWDAGQADAVFVLSLNPTDKTMKIVAIPRNSMVNLNIYGADGEVSEQIKNQICLQYGYAGGGKNGLAEMKRVVSELLYQLPIHGVTAIGYDAIATINDAVGGVDVEVLEDIIYDPQMQKGNVIHLTGEQAYLYLQYRDVTAVGSPTARLLRQKQYLSAFVGAAKGKLRNDPMIVSELYQALDAYMNTDVALDEAVYMAAELLEYRFDMDAIYQLTGEDRIVPYINEDGEEDFYDDYYLDEEALKRMMVEVFYTEVVFS
ncbi:MAG: LCP family protein [bacterium]|nr:LCP family protein [bacterium]